MKTESNVSLSRPILAGFGRTFLVALGACLACSGGAVAGQGFGAAPGQPPALSTKGPSAMPLPSAVSISANPDPSPAMSPQDAGKTQDESIEKNISKAEDKVIENAKSTVKHLDTLTDEATLAEMNHTRQTISRIDAMIDVEKRLGELEKLRNERQHTPPPAPPAPVAAVLASALAAPQQPPNEEQRIIKRESARPNLVRIFGTNGKYTAVLKFAGETAKSVRIGDKLSDGETVRGITSSSIEIGGKDKSYTLRVKNVDVVYSVVR